MKSASDFQSVQEALCAPSCRSFGASDAPRTTPLFGGCRQSFRLRGEGHALPERLGPEVQDRREPDGDALEEYLNQLSDQSGKDLEEIRDALSTSGRMLEVKADISKQAALEWVFERAEIVDQNGEAVDRMLLEPTEPVDALPDGPESAIPADAEKVGETSSSFPEGDEEE